MKKIVLAPPSISQIYIRGYIYNCFLAPIMFDLMGAWAKWGYAIGSIVAMAAADGGESCLQIEASGGECRVALLCTVWPEDYANHAGAVDACVAGAEHISIVSTHGAQSWFEFNYAFPCPTGAGPRTLTLGGVRFSGKNTSVAVGDCYDVMQLDDVALAGGTAGGLQSERRYTLSKKGKGQTRAERAMYAAILFGAAAICGLAYGLCRQRRAAAPPKGMRVQPPPFYLAGPTRATARTVVVVSRPDPHRF